MCVLTVVCGTGLLLLLLLQLLEVVVVVVHVADAAGTDESSCISPLLSKTLESKTRQSVTNCIMRVIRHNNVEERD